MTKARIQQVSLDETPFYHCMVRCVRRAFLCGEDQFSGKNYDHRKQWIVTRLKELSSVFAIDICAYAVLSNHYHAILHVDVETSKAWSHAEVVERWYMIFKGNALIDRWRNGEIDTQAEWDAVSECIEKWRKSLSNISWFMRCMNERIARLANQEDGCKGHFWESRFKSQALIGEEALLTCMAYVDLNPIRAGLANDLETSDYSSIQERLFNYAKREKVKPKNYSQLKKRIEQQSNPENHGPVDSQQLSKAKLMSFDGSSHTSIHEALPYTRADYFELVDVTGRLIREGKKGFIQGGEPPILSKMGIDNTQWITHVKNYGRLYCSATGSEQTLREHAKVMRKSWVKGINAAKQLFRKVELVKVA